MRTNTVLDYMLWSLTIGCAHFSGKFNNLFTDNILTQGVGIVRVSYYLLLDLNIKIIVGKKMTPKKPDSGESPTR